MDLTPTPRAGTRLFVRGRVFVSLFLTHHMTWYYFVFPFCLWCRLRCLLRPILLREIPMSSPEVTSIYIEPRGHVYTYISYVQRVCVCVCVFFPSILDIKFVGRTSRGHTGGRSHRIFNPPSFCGACLDFCREKDSAIPFPR